MLRGHVVTREQVSVCEVAELHRIMDDVRSRAPGTLEGSEATFDAAIAKLSEQGVELVSGSFGFLAHADPMQAVARLHPLWKASSGALFLGCEVLGWNHDQAWAFIAGFDHWPNTDPSKFVDPRAKNHPECVALGLKMREKHLPKGRR
jgi:hypothetical protein